MPRSTDTQKAERLNVVHGLLARGLSIAEVAMVLSDQFAISRRQAYRYVQEAQSIGGPVPVGEKSVAVTFKLAPSLIHAVRSRAATDGATISETVSRALIAFLSESDAHG